MGDNDIMGGNDYNVQSDKYETAADKIEIDCDTITVTGVGCSIRTWGDALEVSSGKTHIPQKDRVTKLYRGTHKVKRIVILSHDGYVTLKAAEWCVSQNIQVVVIDNLCRILLLSGDSECDATLRRAQYQSDDTGISGYIARELVRRKTLAQIEVLKSLPSHAMIEGRIIVMNGQKVTMKAKGELIYGDLIWQAFEDGLSELSNMNDINMIRLFEARLALRYWSYFVGIPISWVSKNKKIVPPHWKTITGRMGTMSSVNSARYAINPFHSALNYGYAVLKSQVMRSIQAAGLDPSCGFLHADKEGRDSLVYDLMEPHRSQVDKLVLRLFMTTTFSKGMVILLESGECKLNPQFARSVVLNCSVPQNDIDDTVKWIVDMLHS
jgi:CRISP-associated protein Cas1